MEPLDAGSIDRGHAEILCTDGAIALLRGHAAQEAGAKGVERLYYAITENDRVVFAGEDSDLAWRRFNEITGHKVNKIGDDSAAGSRHDFLATQPTSLPALVGPTYHKLASQVSELSRNGTAGRVENGDA